MSFHINDLFFTFQGEGKFAGTRSLFVRLPFCNLKCGWCDTTFNSFSVWTEEKFKDFAQSEKTRHAVITGGEPMMNKHADRIVQILHNLGYYVSVESNGTFPVNANYDFITVSPKRFTAGIKHKTGFELPPYFVDATTFQKVNEFKYVVDSHFDFSVLKRHEPFDSPLSAFMYGSYSKGSLKKGPKQQLIKNKDPDFFKSPTRHMIEMVDDLKKTEKFLTNLWKKRGVVWND